MTQISELTIKNFKNGAIIDRLERALSETINHISDPETGLEAREIALSIKIKPTDERDEAEVIVRCETKLKNPIIEESISIDRDLNGRPVASNSFAARQCHRNETSIQIKSDLKEALCEK